MREFELIIDDALKNGLTPYDIVPFNTQILSKCLGFKCGKIGLESYKILSNPISPTINMYYIWPFPQYIVSEKYNILIVRNPINQEDNVYSISDDYLTITHVFDVDELTFGKGTLMEVADFGKYLFMVNGVISIYYDPVALSWQQQVSSATIPTMKTACNFKGQVVGGGIVSSWYDCDETFYVWSKIGSIDFTLDLDNEAGYKRCPFGGNIYHTRRLGDGVIGYSSKGITLITPVGSPSTTFGFSELSNIGLLNQGAMNGSIEHQVYVGEDYILRDITKQGIKELGYQRYMKELINSEDIIISYDPSEKDFYIGNSEKTFLLSQKGLTEITQHPSAVWYRNKEVSLIPSTNDIDKPYLCTEIFDMGYKGNKTIFSIESDATMIDEPEAGIDYSNDLNTWTDEVYKPINNQGIASNIVSGNMFRFRLRFSDIYDSMRISYMKIRYKMTDLRGLRGVYAPGLRGQNKGE